MYVGGKILQRQGVRRLAGAVVVGAVTLPLTRQFVFCRPMSSAGVSPVTGLPPGPFPIGVTSVQFDDHSRTDPDGGPRSLQTEIWYPATDVATSMPKNRFSDFLGKGVIPGSIEAANAKDAIGGYRDGITVEELDKTWPNEAVRDAPVREGSSAWPVVVFSHGSGAYRASYIYWTEFLASQGFVVVACDHPGSARYTQVNGKVVKPGGARSERAQMEADRPKDVVFLIDCMEKLSRGADSRFAGRVDASRCAVTGMSFGGWTSGAVIEDNKDPRIKAAIMQCPSLMSAGGRLGDKRQNKDTPVMLMAGVEDTVIGEKGAELIRQYAASHRGPICLMEIKGGGHVSFTSCNLYNKEYGNGIGKSKSLTQPGQMYDPLPIQEQHAIINSYGLAFLDRYLRDGGSKSEEFLKANQYGDKILYKARL
eukprot:TRINITY_DN31588_c0_g1_i2.p1 TRINITY_DN31588_c0_g1~~TRINITY_DN31588_c0_g1_i2.p1  ORF type:complete len:423 (-),score=72.78 TRINITY_DN31588_c0_g1_i2:397-1665(-)